MKWKGERRRKISMRSAAHGPNATLFCTSFLMMHNLVPPSHIRLPPSTGTRKSICSIHVVKQWCRPWSTPSMGPDVIESRSGLGCLKIRSQLLSAGLPQTPSFIHTHRSTHAYTHIPILPVKLKSDYYRCIPNVLFSKYSSASSAGRFTSPTGRPLQKPALRSPCYILIDRAPLEVRWGGRGWRWRRMAVICDWGPWESLMWEPLAHSVGGSMEAHAVCVRLEQIRPSVFWSEYPCCLITSLKCGLLAMTSMTNRALWFPLQGWKLLLWTSTTSPFIPYGCGH